MRVRQAAQFALVDRSLDRRSAPELLDIVWSKDKLPKFTRLHGIWGLDMYRRQIAKNASPKERQERNDVIAAMLVPLLDEKDVDIRSQTLKVLGDTHSIYAINPVLQAMKAAEPRVRFEAVLALGKLETDFMIPAIADMIRDNADKRPLPAPRRRHGIGWPW